MKHLKKILAVVLAATMVMAMGIGALAADPVTHKITNSSTTHTYEVYQIFTGTYDAESGKLISLRYGASSTKTVGDSVIPEDLKKLAEYTDAGSTPVLDQKDIAFIKQFVDIEGDPFKTIAPGSNESVAEGYYLIKDVDGALSGDEQYTLYLIDVLNEDITITPKTGTVESEKKLDDINDSTGVAENLQDSADYDIGDNVPYHLTAKIADNVGAYKKYHLTFEDTLEAGRFDAISALTIKVDGTAVADVSSDDYTVTVYEIAAPSTSGFKVKVEFVPKENKDLSALAGKNVTIDFTAKLGTGAIIGNPGNVNTLVLKYSNNPNSTDGSDEGTAPEDTVIVFTYDVVVNKVDEDGYALNGASFALYKEYTEAQLAATGKTAVTEIKYNDGKNTYNFGTKKYVKLDEINGAAKSTFTFTGVDDGNYLLVETKAPTGYNVLEPKIFSINATHTATADINKTTKKDANGNYILTSVSGTGDITLAQHTKADGNIDGVSSDIENQSGAVLPATGGIGTTLFYIVGGILVIGAGVVLVSRRRMSDD